MESEQQMILIKGYKTYYTRTEADKGGTLLYIANNLASKPRKDLDLLLCESWLLESVFVEIVNKVNKSFIGCIYKHPSMDRHKLNQNYLNPLMEKLSAENEKRNIYLIGAFNVDLLNIVK